MSPAGHKRAADESISGAGEFRRKSYPIHLDLTGTRSAKMSPAGHKQAADESISGSKESEHEFLI
jgi:hypothetical protein